MTGREKIQAAISCEGTAEIPAVICYPNVYYRDHWSALTQQPWWALSSGKLELCQAVYRDFIRNVPQDWLYPPALPPLHERMHTVIAEESDGVCLVNTKTGHRKHLPPPAVGGWKSGALHSKNPENPPQTTEDVDRWLHLSTPTDQDSPLDDGTADLIQTLVSHEARDLSIMGFASTPYARCYGLWSFDEMMLNVLERPSLVHYACRRLLDAEIAQVRRQARMGIQGIWIQNLMTDMISPAAFREFNLPYLQELAEAIRNAGLFSIHYYCGNPKDRMGLLLEVKADALALEESKKGWEVDIEAVIEHVGGRMAILGNLDSVGVLEQGSDEELRAEVLRQIRTGRRNRSRFIMSLGSPVTPGASVARVRLYCELAHDLGARH